MKGVSDALSLNTDPPRAETLYSVQLRQLLRIVMCT